MKRFINASIILFLVFLFSNIVSAEYFPLTVESAEKAWEDVRKQFYSDELPDFEGKHASGKCKKNSGWLDKIKVILTTMDPSTNNAAYRLNTYGVTSSEDFVYLASPAWPSEYKFESDEYPWTIPDIVYSDVNISLYWVMNADILNNINDDRALIGMLMHEFGHMYDYRPDKQYSENTCILGTTGLHYRGKEKWIDSYNYCSKGHLGSVIPMYSFAKWIETFFPALPTTAIPNYPVPSTPVAAVFKSADIKKWFFEDVYRSLRSGLAQGKTEQEILGPLYEAYIFLKNN